MTYPAEIRAEGRRLREALWWTEPDSEEGRTATAAWSEWLEEHADVLLADPAPVGLTASVPLIGTGAGEVETAPAGDRERVPEGWRVEWTQASHESFAMPRLVPVSASVDPEEG